MTAGVGVARVVWVGSEWMVMGGVGIERQLPREMGSLAVFESLTQHMPWCTHPGGMLCGLCGVYTVVMTVGSGLVGVPSGPRQGECTIRPAGLAVSSF
ncbi:hypothetical protein FGB62_25g437 [Gracilaria domingensis]|nr:hypothetical protein FGB62_432g00 [Gracilaria domingensis]KAI0557245.1 hypothetical protein FGB62_327g09 [Gracilaria domingensis]KAI0559115.1 hypothetical protein FGB62_168g017 [Gracilaria domingensis]KAI0560698.1 hypothetical protein FGB62_104g112 [Gracilaria domingensis]KAI0564596.1 hypothetical protein FGB62_25g437 [Gracilaria domingensis]